jgi:hypothetical protein
MRPVLIVSLHSRVESIQRAVQQFVHPQGARAVTVVGVSTIRGDRITPLSFRVIDEANKLARQMGVDGFECVIVLDKELKISVGALSGIYDLVEKASLSALNDTQSRRGSRPLIRKLLDVHGLSTLAFARTALSHWAHGTVDENAMKAWLSQFDRIGASGVGETLLAHLHVIPATALGEALCGSKEMLEHDAICVLSDAEVPGKSAEILKNMVHKRFPHSKLFSEPADITTRNGAGGNEITVHILEDGLWTGTEIIGVMDSLLGKRKPPAHLKVRPLSNVTDFNKWHVHLRYAMACDYGLGIVQKYLEVSGITNVALTVPPPQVIEVLTAAGKEWISNATDVAELWQQGPPVGAVSPFVLQDTATWGGEGSISSVRKVLEGVGQQLFRRYLESKVESSNWTMWPDEKIAKCGMGMWGLGLAIAFSHSVPKATLPHFWSEGEVKFNGVTINWLPLFPNSA